jgi:hypothetical protein
MSSPLRLLAVAALASACSLSAQGPALIQGSSRPAYLPLDGVTLRGLGQGPAVTLDGNIMFALSDARAESASGRTRAFPAVRAATPRPSFG